MEVKFFYHKSSNTTCLKKFKYNELISNIIQLKHNFKRNEAEWLLSLKKKKYDVLKIADVNKLIVLVYENNEIKYYVHNEELFDVIKV